MNLLGDNTEVSMTFDDPFVKDQIKAIHIHIMKGIFNREFGYSATIECQWGERKFEAESFPMLMHTIDQFIKQMKDTNN